MKTFKQHLMERDTLGANPVTTDAYHGSGHHFTNFDQAKSRVPNDHMGGGVGYFTSDHGVAKTYAKAASKKTGTPHIYHTTLKMKNVFDVDHTFTGTKLKHVLPDEKHHEDFARGAGMLPFGSNKHKVMSDLKSGNASISGHQVFKGLSRGNVNTSTAREHLMKKGYDGLRYNGGDNMGAKKHDVYIPYHQHSISINNVEKPDQPKSVPPVGSIGSVKPDVAQHANV